MKITNIILITAIFSTAALYADTQTDAFRRTFEYATRSPTKSVPYVDRVLQWASNLTK